MTDYLSRVIVEMIFFCLVTPIVGSFFRWIFTKNKTYREVLKGLGTIDLIVGLVFFVAVYLVSSWYYYNFSF